MLSGFPWFSLSLLFLMVLRIQTSLGLELGTYKTISNFIFQLNFYLKNI